MEIRPILEKYDTQNITIACLGGHSALDVCEGAKREGFKTVVVARKGREKTYEKYYRTRKNPLGDGEIGCIDDIILVDQFSDVLNDDIQAKLQAMNAVFVHNRYFWVYFKDFNQVEQNFHVPIYGNRVLVRLEERDQPKNQYYLLQQAGIKTPEIVREGGKAMDIDTTVNYLDEFYKKNGEMPLIVKVNEAIRGYERAFFIINKAMQYKEVAEQKIEAGEINESDLGNAVIEEFIIGAQVNFNYFYSPLTGELELMGTDMRRQTSLDGFLRLNADEQMKVLETGYKPSMVETGHVAVTTKESLLEKAFSAGEQFIETLKKEVSPGMIGPFALQGAIASYKGKEEFVVFDVSMRIPGSPGTRFTPTTSYLYGEPMSYGQRIAKEIKLAQKQQKLEEILT